MSTVQIVQEPSDSHITCQMGSRDNHSDQILVSKGKGIRTCPECGSIHDQISIRTATPNSSSITWCPCGAISVFDPGHGNPPSAITVYSFRTYRAPREHQQSNCGSPVQAQHHPPVPSHKQPEPAHISRYGIYRGNPPYTQSMLVESIDSLIFLKSTCLRLAEKHKNLWLIDRTDGDTTQVVKDGEYTSRIP